MNYIIRNLILAILLTIGALQITRCGGPTPNTADETETKSLTQSLQQSSSGVTLPPPSPSPSFTPSTPVNQPAVQTAPSGLTVTITSTGVQHSVSSTEYILNDDLKLSMTTDDSSNEIWYTLFTEEEARQKTEAELDPSRRSPAYKYDPILGISKPSIQNAVVTYILNVRAYDTSGNKTAPKTYRYHLDKKPPVLSFPIGGQSPLRMYSGSTHGLVIDEPGTVYYREDALELTERNPTGLTTTVMISSGMVHDFYLPWSTHARFILKAFAIDSVGNRSLTTTWTYCYYDPFLGDSIYKPCN